MLALLGVKSGLDPGFAPIWKCASDAMDGIVTMHTDVRALQEENSFALIPRDSYMRLILVIPIEP